MGPTPVLKSLRSDSRFHDVKFVCEGGVTVTANKAVLAATCPYFDTMFFGTLSEATANEVRLHDVYAEGLEIVLDWLHGIEPQNIGANAATAAGYLLADKYGIATLEEYILQRIRTASPLPNRQLDELLTPALVWCLQPLLQAAILAFDGGSIMRAPCDSTGSFCSMFHDLSLPVVCHLLQYAPMFIPEHKVLQHLVRWAQSEPHTHSPHSTSQMPSQPPSRSASPSQTLNTSSSIDLEQLRAVAWEHVDWPHGAHVTSESETTDMIKDDKPSSLEATPSRFAAVQQSHERSQSACSSVTAVTGSYGVFSGVPSSFLDKLQAVLPFVQLQCVRPSVLASLLEPLGVLKAEELLTLYRKHAISLEGGRLPACFEAPLRGCWNPQVAGFVCAEGKPYRLLCDRVVHGGVRTVVPFGGTAVRTWCIEVVEPCEFLWVGVTDETTDMAEWLGKQSGGWMYGSNDAVCHNTQQDNGPYNRTLGLGPWTDKVYCRWDPLEHTLHFATDSSLQACGTQLSPRTGSIAGSNDLDNLPTAMLADVQGPSAGPCGAPVPAGWALGFKSVPSVVYPAVSMRAPGIVELRLIE